MQNRKGLFIQKLFDEVEQYNIPFIGINRKYINKAMVALEIFKKRIKNKKHY